MFGATDCSRKWRADRRRGRRAPLKVMLKASGKRAFHKAASARPCSATFTSMRWTRCWSGAGGHAKWQVHLHGIARVADGLVILIDAYKRHDWLVGAVDKRLREESASCRLKSMVKRAAQWT